MSIKNNVTENRNPNLWRYKLTINYLKKKTTLQSLIKLKIKQKCDNVFFIVLIFFEVRKHFLLKPLRMQFQTFVNIDFFVVVTLDVTR